MRHAVSSKDATCLIIRIWSGNSHPHTGKRYSVQSGCSSAPHCYMADVGEAADCHDETDNWTVHDGHFFASAVLQSKARSPTEERLIKQAEANKKRDYEGPADVGALLRSFWLLSGVRAVKLSGRPASAGSVGCEEQSPGPKGACKDAATLPISLVKHAMDGNLQPIRIWLQLTGFVEATDTEGRTL